MPLTLEILGYAIVSADGRIANHEGRFPKSLHFQADHTRFQSGLDEADLTLLGRRTHEATPNVKSRTRLVLSRRVEEPLREDPSTLWCNPDRTDLANLLRSLATVTGRVAVAGGTGVYELVGAGLGYTAFDLTVAENVRLPGGSPLLPGCEHLDAAKDRFEEFGLVLRHRSWLDRDARLRLFGYRRSGADSVELATQG